MAEWTFAERWRWAWADLRLTGMIGEKRFDDALQLIEAQTTHNRPTSWSIREFAVHHWKGDDLWVVEHADDLLDAIRHNLFFTPIERAYLDGFVRLVAQRSSGILSKSGRAGERAYLIDFDAIDLTRVPSRWKRTFPLATHPKWPRK